MHKKNSLPPQVKAIIFNKATETPNSGEYTDLDESGTYLCRNCGIALFRADNKFHSSCGWPSFDQEILGNVKYVPDSDRIRTEITCSRCNGHLGHVFKGEAFTPLNTRHCVNSLALDFVSDSKVLDTEEAIFAAGCFWGVEYYLKKLAGILKTEVGYTGGSLKNPTYQQVCTGNTGHLEAIRVVYDPKQVSYEQLVKYFFEIHDFEQSDGQGPDIGEQYLSAIFYYNEQQHVIAQKTIEILANKRYHVATELRQVSIFWAAEKYHQGYYAHNGHTPYCHSFRRIFD